jgi:hypothetical protein
VRQGCEPTPEHVQGHRKAQQGRHWLKNALCLNSPTATLAAAAPVLVESFEPIISTPQDDSGDRLYARRDANRHGLQSISRLPDRSRRTARQGHGRKLRQGRTLNRRRNHNLRIAQQAGAALLGVEAHRPGKKS